MNAECLVCGQTHPNGPHVYDFIEEADDDICCSICLSPFLSPTDLPCCHTFCRACILPYLRKNPYCPQDRKPAPVHECRDSSLVLRRICDKLKVTCPKCQYETERNLLSDHLSKCGRPQTLNGNGKYTRQPLHAGRTKTRLPKNAKSPIKWHRSRDRLDARSRGAGDSRARSHSRDALGSNSNGNIKSAKSIENLAENAIAREIERDIEQINRHQDRLNEEKLAKTRRHKSTPTSLIITGRPGKISSEGDSNADRELSSPNLNSAQIINSSDLSDNSSIDQANELRKYYSTVDLQSKLIDVRIPLDENLDHTSGISLVGGSDTPLKGIFIQSIHAECTQYSKSIIREGDRLKKILGRNIEQFTHSEAVTLFAKSTLNSREIELQIERQNGCEIEKTTSITLQKLPGQQVGIKLVTQQNQVRIFSVVPGSVAFNDGRLHDGDVLLLVANHKVRTSEEAAKEIIKAKNETSICLVVSRITKPIQNEISQRPYYVIADQASVRLASTIPSNSFEKVIIFKKLLGESLGLGIAGGLGSLHGDVPVFVLDVKQGSKVAIDGRIKKGDLLISINSKTVTGLRHYQVVEHLKDVARRETDIKIVACEFNYRNRDAEDKISFSQTRPSTCTWRHWLALPPRFLIYRETNIKRDVSQPLGLSIVGGDGEPVMIKFCTPGSVSFNTSHLRSGDEILSINSHSVTQLNQADIRSLLMAPNIRVVFLSWPGCLL